MTSFIKQALKPEIERASKMSQLFGPDNGDCSKKFLYCNGMAEMPGGYFI
jgi:hypothetical protein